MDKARFVENETLPAWFHSEIREYVMLRGHYKYILDQENYRKQKSLVRNKSQKVRNVSFQT